MRLPYSASRRLPGALDRRVVAFDGAVRGRHTACVACDATPHARTSPGAEPPTAFDTITRGSVTEGDHDEAGGTLDAPHGATRSRALDPGSLVDGRFRISAHAGQ